MPARLRSKLSYANVTATVALFAAMGGGAYAAATVGSGDVINGSLRSVDLKNGQVRSADAADDGITGTDILESTLAASRVIARSGFDGSLATSGANVSVDVPLEGTTSWVQASNEIDQIFAEATVVAPPMTCNADDTAAEGYVEVGVYVDGRRVAGGSLERESERATIDLSGGPASSTLMPSEAGSHTLTATISDTCQGTENGALENLTVYVVGHR